MCSGMKSFKRRREIVESIPKNTPYCYTEDKVCPYFKKGRCKLYKCDIDDMVKNCGINIWQYEIKSSS